MKSLYLPLFLLLFSACVSPKNKIKKQVHYFDSKELVNRQIQLMDSLQPRLVKKAILNGQEETKTLEAAKIDWKDELNTFLNTNINESSYLGFYTISHPKETTTRYTLKPDSKEDKLPVKQLELIYSDSSHKHLIQLHAHTRQKNELFILDKSYQLEFNAKDQLQSYEVEGFQKMQLKDSVILRIKGKIEY